MERNAVSDVTWSWRRTRHTKVCRNASRLRRKGGFSLQLINSFRSKELYALNIQLEWSLAKPSHLLDWSVRSSKSYLNYSRHCSMVVEYRRGNAASGKRSYSLGKPVCRCGSASKIYSSFVCLGILEKKIYSFTKLSSYPNSNENSVWEGIGYSTRRTLIEWFRLTWRHGGTECCFLFEKLCQRVRLK